MKKILVIDYDQGALASLQGILVKEGYEVVTAGDGQAGWDKFNRESPDLVLKGVFARNGELPCDPSGGTLCTNPIGATGLIRTAEAALQVTGRAGDHQIPGAKLALCHAMGGVDQFNGVMILGAEP